MVGKSDEKIKRRKRMSESYRRFFLNVTHRCSPTGKHWLFSSSFSFGIYPTRVGVLLQGQSFASQGLQSSAFSNEDAQKPDATPQQEYGSDKNYFISEETVNFDSPSDRPQGPGPPVGRLPSTD
ncbi:hypothetical protein Avbf_04206, partial [Armadillidium vulgare]